VTAATANPGRCSEVCSGGVGSQGSASQHSSTPDESGATLPHDSRPRWVAASSLYSTASTAPKTVRVITHSDGFRWGAAGIACSAVLRGLNPAERHYVVAIASLTYTQLAAAFGTKEVNISTRPIDSCNLGRELK
jgi:hypothetical protein